jgi:hypothetical protein
LFVVAYQVPIANGLKDAARKHGDLSFGKVFEDVRLLKSSLFVDQLTDSKLRPFLSSTYFAGKFND